MSQASSTYCDHQRDDGGLREAAVVDDLNRAAAAAARRQVKVAAGLGRHHVVAYVRAQHAVAIDGDNLSREQDGAGRREGRVAHDLFRGEP